MRFMKRLDTNHIKRIGLMLFLSLFLLVACSSGETIRVVITPTPDPDVPTFTPLPTLEPSATVVVPTAETLVPTNTPQVQQVGPTNTFVGPIIDSSYVLPTLEPQLQDIPTETPQPIPTGTILAPVTPTVTYTPSITPTPTISPTPIPQLDANRMGIQVDSNMEYNQFEQLVGHINTIGVRWVKIQVDWGRLQPNGPNDFNQQIQLLEQQIELLDRSPINVMLSIAKAPQWARLTDQSEDGTPDNPQHLADFITFLLGTKIGPIVDAIEVWNEPNLIREWRGALPFGGAGYMQLFAPAYTAIRAYSPTMMIITAGLAPTSNLEGAIDDREFLSQMYSNGLGDYQDIAIGIHPYGWGNAPDAVCCDQIPDRGWDEDPHFYFLSNIQDMRQIMENNGHSNLQMWVTEFGWATWEGIPNDPPELWMTYNTAQDQANYVVRAFEIGQSLPYLGPMMLWNLNFATEAMVLEQRDERTAYSALNPVVFPSERPLYWAIARASGAFTP